MQRSESHVLCNGAARSSMKLRLLERLFLVFIEDESRAAPTDSISGFREKAHYGLRANSNKQLDARARLTLIYESAYVLFSIL